MERLSGRGEQISAAVEVEAVVDVAPVGRAPARRDDCGCAQLAQVIRDQTLRLLEPAAQLSDPTVTLRQLAEQAPANRVAGQP